MGNGDGYASTSVATDLEGTVLFAISTQLQGVTPAELPTFKRMVSWSLPGGLGYGPLPATWFFAFRQTQVLALF